MSYRLPLLTVLTVLAVLGGAASAEQYRIGDLVIESPWSREMPPVAETGAVWFLVENRGAADRIVSADSPIAAETELHAHEVEDGVVKMRRLASVEVPAGSETAFAPGGRHVMLIGLEEPLVAGAQPPGAGAPGPPPAPLFFFFKLMTAYEMLLLVVF